ncbi:MAG: DoxX family protein [Marinilabiliales bacterium]|nr:MAG: DoxX family protein [Marinilabiliales bacterium]
MRNDMVNRTDAAVTRWMSKNGLILLRISIGVVFFWFGILKFFPGLSPATDIATRTIETLTFGIVTGKVALVLLAALEVVIGAALISGVFLKATLLLLLFQMIGTVTPVFLFPSEVFTQIPYAPTLEGQYIIKNIIIVSAAFVLWAANDGSGRGAVEGTDRGAADGSGRDAVEGTDRGAADRSDKGLNQDRA